MREIAIGMPVKVMFEDGALEAIAVRGADLTAPGVRRRSSYLVAGITAMSSSVETAYTASAPRILRPLELIEQ